MTTLYRLQCKDCPEWFAYSEEAAGQDRLLGRTPPERCPACRQKHRREYQSLGMSHYDVLQLRTDGVGGLAHFRRPRAEPKAIKTQRLAIDPFPIEAIIGAPDRPGSLLHGLLSDQRKVHLVVGPTGSGKSTWLPFRLLTCTKLVARGPVVVTQPRIPATEGPAKFVGKLYYGDEVEPAVGPGLAVGYRYSEIGDTMRDSANRLLFTTDGTLLGWLQSGEIRRYSVVMIDEAHERSVNIDKILALLRLKLPEWPHLQVIIASATVDSEVFLNYFGGSEQVAVYQSTGFTYPILEVFADESLVHCPDELWTKICQSAAVTMNGAWQEVPEDTRTQHLLGPPCWHHSDFQDYRLRYYRQFEALILRGPMSSDKQRLLQVGDASWQTVVTALAEASQRERRIGNDSRAPITDSIRGKPMQAESGQPVRVDANIRNRLIHASVDTVLSLIERDRTEAEHRLARWERRQTYGWPDLHRPLPVGHILVFLPTSIDIEQCVELIEAELEQRSWQEDNRVLRFYKDAPVEEKRQATAECVPDERLRRIVIGSNLAETSLTLHGLTYVVDSGLICEEYFDPEQGKQLPTILHSQAGCRQRVGRVGRKEPGEAYRLYTRDELRRQSPFTTPQIARCNAETVVLDLIRAGLPPDPETLNTGLINPPIRSELDRAFGVLQHYQAIDEDGDVTHRGEELATIEGQSFLEAQLRCEADRFGVLWEMAVFLAFLQIGDTAAPPRKIGTNKRGPSRWKWLGLWDPTARAISDDTEDDALPDKKRSPWHNPYVLGDVLLKRRHLLKDCLDDLELYLRIWQGWHAQSTPEARQHWAQCHGVSHAALLKVESLLGLGPKDEKGLLHRFWDMQRKGVMQRDVDFTRLDTVRFLYAAACPERLFERSQANQFSQYQGPAKQPRAFLHGESVWHAADTRLQRFGREIERRFCVAAIKPKGQIRELRHVVWLDPDWLQSEQPLSFNNSPLVLARRFAMYADQVRAWLGEQPFQSAEAKAGLPMEMPAINIPTPDRIDQWRQQHQQAIESGAMQSAKLSNIISAPQVCSQTPVFVRLSPECEIPLDVASATLAAEQLAPGSTVKVRLVMDQGLLYGSLGTVSHPHKQAEVVSLRPPRPTSMPPVDLIVTAEVVKVVCEKRLHGFIARIVSPDHTGCEIGIDYLLPETTLRREATTGRRLQAKIKSRGKQRAFGRLQRWCDDGPVRTLTDDWPIGTVLDAVVRGVHPKHDFLIQIDVPLSEHYRFRWSAKLGKERPEDAREGRQLQIRVTRWNPGSPWPHLKLLRWLD